MNIMDDKRAVLDELREIRRRRAALTAAELTAVAKARTLRVTWDEIGDATGMAGPNAHRKFGRSLKVTVEALEAQVEADAPRGTWPRT